MEKEATVKDLMEWIVGLDILPTVFKLHLIATDHTAGFLACVDFRGGGTTGMSFQGDTPEEALRGLRDTILSKFGKCPHCGSYRGE